MLLLTMAEMLRRGSEDVFARDLPEEDDLRFGPFASKLKLENYGAERILDGDARVEARWLQSFRLGTGVRLRWYVEGYTEFHALKSFFGSCLAIDLVNLRGQIVARGNKLAFRDNLRSDINSMIFSFISFDDDVSDNLRVVRKAAEDDEICGRFFVAEQDFEFDNFTVPELASILWEQARNNGQTIDITRQQLANAVHNATTASEVFSAARRLSNCFYGVDKGESWGRALMEYAVENPHKSLSGSNLEVKRPILEAIGFAIRTSQLEYQPSRANTVVNPATGIPEERLKAKK